MRKHLFMLGVVAFLQSCSSDQTHRKIASESIPDVVIGEGSSEALDELKTWPLAQENKKRTVIYLPQREDCYSEFGSCEVEILSGKTAVGDCNQSWFGGKIKEEIIEGWGYSYYQVEVSPNFASTRMGCFEPPREKFISGPRLKVRYISSLPLVIYSDKDVTIKYRIWKAEAIFP